MTIKERIIEVLKHFEVGLTYNNLLEQYKGDYHEDLKWGYEHIKQLRNKNIIESYKSQNTKGKALTYRLIATEEPDHSDTILTDKIIEVLVKSGANSDDYGVEISEKEIIPSIKRLTESGKLG